MFPERACGPRLHISPCPDAQPAGTASHQPIQHPQPHVSSGRTYQWRQTRSAACRRPLQTRRTAAHGALPLPCCLFIRCFSARGCLTSVWVEFPRPGRPRVVLGWPPRLVSDRLGRAPGEFARFLSSLRPSDGLL